MRLEDWQKWLDSQFVAQEPAPAEPPAAEPAQTEVTAAETPVPPASQTEGAGAASHPAITAAAPAETPGAPEAPEPEAAGTKAALPIAPLGDEDGDVPAIERYIPYLRNRLPPAAEVNGASDSAAPAEARGTPEANGTVPHSAEEAGTRARPEANGVGYPGGNDVAGPPAAAGGSPPAEELVGEPGRAAGVAPDAAGVAPDKDAPAPMDAVPVARAAPSGAADAPTGVQADPSAEEAPASAATGDDRPGDTAPPDPVNSAGHPAAGTLPSPMPAAAVTTAPRRRAGVSHRRARYARNVRPADVVEEMDPVVMWNLVPKHIQALVALEADEVAQNSYRRRFKESRFELVSRLLDPTLSLEDAARILNVCPTTVRRYTNKGLLTHQRTTGDQRRFKLSDVLAFLEAQSRV